LQLASVSLRSFGWGLGLAALVEFGPVVIKAYRAWRQTNVSALVISTREAERLRWPQGDPTKYELYIGSPADPQTYYPAATFHENVLFERYGELRELLTRLGARRIHTIVRRGRGLDGSISVEGPSPGGAGTLAAEAGMSSATASSREDIRELAPLAEVDISRVSTGLHWYSREADWQRLTDLCAKGRLRRERVYLRQTSDFGVNANFEAAVKSLPVSIGLGGKYKKYEETAWEVDATFAAD
jgi:hypothetical protein